MKTNELTSKDLMIGDWVQHCNGTPMQVTRITTEHFCASTGGISSWEYHNKYEPIPLTPEILEKNGFELKSESPYSQYFAIDFDDVDIDYLVVELHQKANYVRVNYQTEKGKVHLSCSLGGCHLHKLQHLLKLCKLDFDWKL